MMQIQNSSLQRICLSGFRISISWPVEASISPTPMPRLHFADHHELVCFALSMLIIVAFASTNPMYQPPMDLMVA